MATDKKKIQKASGRNKNSERADEIPKETKIDNFPIVGIGASAGGLEALEQFFTNFPENNEIAFVVIQHLAPDYIGVMPELIQRFTSMKVYQASDGLKVKPNHVYVIPPNKSMSIEEGFLHLFVPAETRGFRLPVDIFFLSLAKYKLNDSIGIVLSGMGSDGSLGLKAIKEKNGLVLVQDPQTAKFDGMPTSAIQAVNADIVASAELLPGKLLSYFKAFHTHEIDTDFDITHENSLAKIIRLLREYTGHDFSMYKKSTMFRRIERRKGVHKLNTIRNYVDFLKANPGEIEILFKELLIGVTSFFRDKSVWEMLQNKVIPELIKKLPEGYVLRCWIPACSTGEEAYSLAIIFREVFGRVNNDKNLSVHIFATDLDTDSIEKARKGFFETNLVSDVSPDLLNKYFIAEDDGYRILNSLREMIVFAPQNVIKDPPFTRLDFLSCRNMMIYMEPELQKKLIKLFNYSLKPGGIMLFGTAETPGSKTEGFQEIDSKLKIYLRIKSLKTPQLIDIPSSFYRPEIMNYEKKEKPKEVESIQSTTDQIIIQHFAPASVLVTKNGDIVYITGQTGKYLEPAAGKANWNIHAMAREGLRNEMPGAFRKALQNFEPVVLPNIKIKTNGSIQVVELILQQLEKPDSLKEMILVVFKDVSINYSENLSLENKKRKGNLNICESELQVELQKCYEEILRTREEMQTSQEELKSTNEELQSTNEELQSSNEELTSSKEEMQSLNEELQTVNAELQNKVNQFVRAQDDMKNLLNSTEIATLFLDKELNIRRFTDQVTNIIKLRNADIGRPFTDLVIDLQYPEIEKHAKQVLKTLNSIETATVTNDGRWFNVRIMPYRTIDDHIDGLVITFSDISVSKKMEIELKRADELLRKNK